MIFRHVQTFACLLFCSPLTSIIASGQSSFDFDGSVTAGTALNVSGAIGDVITVYQVPNVKFDCGSIPRPPAPVPAGVTALPLSGAPVTLTAAKQTLTLATPRIAGDFLCLVGQNGLGNNSSPKPQTVLAAASTIRITNDPTAGKATISVQSTDAAQFWIYSFPATYTPNPASKFCTAADVADTNTNATPIKIGPRGDSSESVGANTSMAFQVTNNLAEGTQLCLKGELGAGTFLYSAFTPVISQISPVRFNGSIAPGSTISVVGQQTASVSLYSMRTGVSCDGKITSNGTLLKLNPDAPSGFNMPASGANLTLVSPVTDGERLCLAATPAGAAAGSLPTGFEAGNVVGFIRFAKSPIAGDMALVVEGDPPVAGDPPPVTFKAYKFPSTFKPASGASCTQADLTAIGIQQLPLSSTASGTKSDSIAMPAPTPPGVTATVYLAAPLPAGDILCLEEDYNGAVFSTAQTVAAPPSVTQEPSFAHSFYTVGAVISNQLSSSNSSTAAQYIDLGFTFKFRDEGDNHAPGFNTSFSGRFTSIPVAAGSASAAATTPSTSTPLNVLSSQESARVMGTAFLPFWLGPRNIQYGDALYAGPVVKASFSTLINPSATVAPASGTTLVTPQFSPTYNDWSIGGRLGWRRYPKSGPVQTMWQIDATMGKFTNLQDIFCNHSKDTTTLGVTPAPTNTSCYDTPVTTMTTGGTTTTTTYTTYRPDRVSVPRIELDGFARIPSTIFVIGIDANLSQYQLHVPKYLDTMNRAGSDVRIYFGITGSISDLFKKLSLPTAP